jgi:hypothetical protein
MAGQRPPDVGLLLRYHWQPTPSLDRSSPLSFKGQGL